MADALQLLESNRLAVGDAFNRIGNTLESLNRTQMQVAEFQVQTAHTQFQMAETARRTDADIASTAFRNNLAAAEHQANMQLMPLRLEAEKLRLETARVQQKRMLEDDRLKNFNEITAPFSAQMGAEFARNQNPDFAKNYLEVQARWRAKIARGEPFDENMFANDLSYIRSEFGGNMSKEEYNPEVTQLLGLMGATKEQARYETKNPVFAGNITGLKAAAILGGNDSYAGIMGKYGHLFTDEESTNLALAAESYNTLGAHVKQMEQERMSLYRTWSATEDEGEKARLQQEIARRSEDITAAQNQRDSVYKAVISGKPVESTTRPQPPEMSEFKRRVLEESKEKERQRQELGRDIDVEPARPMEGNAKVIDQQALDLQEARGRFKMELEGLDFSAIRNSPTAKFDQNVKTVRNQVLRNIEEVPDIAAYFQQKVDNGDMRKIFEKLKRRGSPVEIDNAFQPKKYQSEIGFGADVESAVIGESGFLGGLSYGDFWNGSQFIEDFEDFQKLVNDFQGTEHQKDLFLRDLYANMVTADAIGGF
jgi:hypothetical protein